ncbi:MAG TPA: hypothetical protein VFB12_29220 [Ktedonobacteraceae bacterium]|nr:hypothetical protein [Ktedonobacteraceae bacterium]
MSSGTLYRLSGCLLVLSGLLSLIGTFLIPSGIGEGVAFYTNALTVAGFLLGFLSVLLALLGLPGLYVRQANKAGVLGLVGVLMAFVGFAFLDLSHSFVNFAIWPALAEHAKTAPIIASAGDLDVLMQSGPYGMIFPLAVIISILGSILFGVAIIRANILPRWVGVIFIVAALTPLLSFVLPGLLGVLTLDAPYVALACGGIALLTGTSESVPQTSFATNRSS